MSEHFTGTRAVAPEHAIDERILARWLAAHVSGFHGPLAVSQFKGGQSNPTYRLETPSRLYVLRAKPGPAAKLLPSAHAVEREYRVMKALEGSAVPVPRMEVLCEDEAVIGRAFYVMELVEGVVRWDPSLPEVPREARGPLFDEMNRVLAALHTVDVTAVGLDDFGKPGSYFERQIARWSKQYTASITTPIEDMDRLMEWLPANLPSSARDGAAVSIVHGDFRMDNLVFHPTRPEVRAVLDWELSTVGHPLADLSYHCMTWRIPPGAFRGMGMLDLDELGIPHEAAYVRRYCQRTGRDPSALEGDWSFYLAFNAFRLAAILQGIAKRVEAGTASSAQAREAGAAAPALAALAWSFAENARAGVSPWA